MGNTETRANRVGTTHVSNASKHVLWVMVDSDRDFVIKSSNNLITAMKELKSTDETERNREILNIGSSIGFTKLLPRNFLPFSPGGDTDSVYITIYFQNPETNGELETICVAYPRLRDFSVTVRRDNQIHAVDYGELW